MICKLFATLSLLLLLSAPALAGKESWADADKVPSSFTVYLDDPEGVRLIMHAEGFITIDLETSRAIEVGKANCEAWSVRHRIPGSVYFSGFITLEPDNVLKEPYYTCIFTTPLDIQVLENHAENMKPPRKVLFYNPETLEVRFGLKGEI